MIGRGTRGNTESNSKGKGSGNDGTRKWSYWRSCCSEIGRGIMVRGEIGRENDEWSIVI